MRHSPCQTTSYSTQEKNEGLGLESEAGTVSAMLAHVLNPQQVLVERLKLTDRESWDSKDGMTE